MKPKLRIGSLVLRAVAVAVASMCIAWGVAPSSAIVSAVAGSLFGVVIGQLLGRTRLRLPAIVGMAALFGGAAFLLAGLVVNHEAIPRAIGTGMALRLSLVLRFGAVALAAFGALRAVATRRPSALVLELGAIAGSIAYVFAAHREGIISRPLWLSDWAWEHGYDPVNVFLVLGGVAVVVLGLLLVAEAEERRGSAAAVLALFAVLGVVLIITIGPPKAEVDDRLGLTGPNPSGSASASAAPTLPPPPKPPPSGQPDAGDVDGGARPQNQDPDGGGAQPQTDPDGGAPKPQNQDPDGGGAQPQTPDGGGGPQDASTDSGGDQSDAASDGGDKNDAGDSSAPPPKPASEDFEPNKDDSPPESPSPMAVVLLDNDYSPPSQVYYFRQEAWSQWNGTKLVRTSRADVDLDGLESFPSEPGPVRDPIADAGREKVSAQVALLVDHTRPFALESPVSFTPLRNPNPARFVRAYGFESLAQSISYKKLRGYKAGNPTWSEEVQKYYLQTSDDPRYARLAKAIRDGMNPKSKDDPFLSAVAIKLFLDDNYKYSRKEAHSGVADPTADFLFGNHIGYCVHFAHAAVLLWRTIGLPSRVGTGYAVEEKNRQGGSAMVIRAADAHAWPELYLEGVGWVIIDVTPHESLDPSPPPVDEDLQRLLGEMARQLPPDPTKTEIAPPTKPDWKGMARAVAMFLGAMASALLVMAYLAKGWRRAAPLWAGPRALPRVGYRTSLDLLSEAGYARDVGESREAFAERVRAKVPSFEKVTSMHLAGRMGRGRDAADDAPEETSSFADALGERSRSSWRAALANLRNDLGSVPVWRRMLGFINPVSFFKSR